MTRQKVDPEVRKRLLKARKELEELSEKEVNEAETVTYVYNIFEMLGYKRHKNITQELVIKGTVDDEYCDLALQCEDEEPPKILVEIKRASLDLKGRHLKQIKSYSLNIGSKWAILTNSKEWQLYHISYDQPPEMDMIYTWNILSDELATVAERFNLICLKNVRKGYLEKEWDVISALSPRNLLKAIVSIESIKTIRSKLKKVSGTLTTPKNIYDGIRELLNETAINELQNIKIDFSSTTRNKKSNIQK